jgi:hypothetical protein
MPEDTPAMTDPYQQRWWTRLRRAFGVPDLVRDDAARMVIAHDVAQQSQSDDFARYPVAKALVEALLTLGQEGELDVLLFDEDRQAPFDNPHTLSIDERIKRMAIDSGGVHSPQPGSATEWQKMMEFLRNKIVDHVREWPYEAAKAHYLPAR